MTQRRGIVRVFNMARPRRPARELDLVERAFADMPAGLSLRTKSAHLARRVVEELMARASCDDPFDRALAALLLAVDADPALELALSEAFGFQGELSRERMARFEARGCRQLASHQWDMETAEIREVLCRRLAARFRRKIMGKN